MSRFLITFCSFLLIFCAFVQADERIAPIVRTPFPEEYSDEYRMFQGISSLAVTDDTHVWVAWYGGGVTEDCDNYVMVIRSCDRGKTWSEPIFCIDQPGAPRQYDPTLWFAPDRKLHIYWAQRPGEFGVAADLYEMVCTDPNSENPQWSAPKYVTRGVCMNKPTADSKGRWILPVSLWRWEDKDSSPEGPTGAWCVISTDEGKTYKNFGRAYTPIEKSLFDEHSIVEKKDGSFWLLNRTKFGIGEFFSTDGGKTWTEFKESAIKHTSSRFFIRRLASGNLIFVKNGKMEEDCGRTNMTAFLSKDDGKTWDGGLLLDDTGYVSYPDGDQTPDGTIFLTYDTGRIGAPMEIRVARITEEDILAGKLVNQDSCLKIVANKAFGKCPISFELNPNQDGSPLQTSQEPATFRTENDSDEIRLFETGCTLFSNRSYALREAPDFLKGRSFVFSELERTKAVCTRGGMMYVVTPMPVRNVDSVSEFLVNQGFKKVSKPEFVLFGDRTNDTVTTFQKEVKAGDVVEFGKWGVLIF